MIDIVKSQFISLTPCSDVRLHSHDVTISQYYNVTISLVICRERGLLAEGAQFMMMAVDYNIQQVLTSQLTGEVQTNLLNYSKVDTRLANVRLSI